MVYEFIKDQEQDESFQAAKELKQRLLHYDETNQERTRVVDMSSDFTESHRWDTLDLSQFKEKKRREKEKIEESMERRKMTMSINFETGEMVMIPVVEKHQDYEKSIREFEKANKQPTLLMNAYVNPYLVTEAPKYILPSQR